VACQGGARRCRGYHGRAAPAVGDGDGNTLVVVINRGSRAEVVRSVLGGDDLQVINPRRQVGDGDRPPSRIQLRDGNAYTRRVVRTGRRVGVAPRASGVIWSVVEAVAIDHKVVPRRSPHPWGALSGESDAVHEGFVIFETQDFEIHGEVASHRTGCRLNAEGAGTDFFKILRFDLGHAQEPNQEKTKNDFNGGPKKVFFNQEKMAGEKEIRWHHQKTI